MISELALQIQNRLGFVEKDANRMERSILEISEITGMDSESILEFIEHGCSVELQILAQNFQWNQFRNLIIKKIKPSHL